MPGLLTIGELSRELGLADWELRRLCARNGIEPARLGNRYRVFGPEDVAKVRAALAEREQRGAAR